MPYRDHPWWIIRHITLARFILIVVLAGSFAVLKFYERKTNNNDAYKYRCFQIRTAAAQVLTDFLNSETGQRGYVVVPESEFLDPYRSGSASVEEDINFLEYLIAGDTGQAGRVRRLRELSREIFRHIRRSIDPAADESTQKYEVAQTKIHMDSMRGVINAITDVATMDSYRAEAEYERSRSRLGMWGNAFLIPIFFLAVEIVSGFFMRRNYTS